MEECPHHTSLVFSLTTAIALQYGLGSPLFPLSLAFSLIVAYDAAGVRRHAGKQAEVLNRILADVFHGSPISDTKLKEVWTLSSTSHVWCSSRDFERGAFICSALPEIISEF